MNAASLYGAARGAGAEPLPRDLEGACRALEKEFANLLFQKMRQAMVPRSTAAAGGFARETAETLLDSQWAELASQGEGLGLWRSLVRELGPEAVKSGPPAADQGSRAGAFPRGTGGASEAGRPAPRAPSGSPRAEAAHGVRPEAGDGEGR